MSSSLPARLWAAAVVVALVAVDPFGWDHFGPIRWWLLPTAAFAALAIQGPPRLGWPPRGAEAAWAVRLAWGAVASLVAADPIHAWIGTPDRRFGWVTWLACGAAFIVGRRAGHADRRLLSRAFALGAAGLGLYATGEWIGLTDAVTPGATSEFAGGRLGGPFGQPALLGAAATLAVPAAIGLALDNTAGDNTALDNTAGDNHRGGWRWLGALGGGLGLVALLGSQSRAAWLGLAAAAAVAAIVARGRDRSASLTAPAAVAVATMAAVALVPALRARVGAVFGADGGLAGRVDEWQVGLRALGSAPLTGHGPEGYRTVFGAHVDEAYVVSWGRDVITDRAHSGPLDVALAFGVPGGVVYLGLLALVAAAAIAVIAQAARRSPSSVDHKRDGPALVGLSVGVLAYGIQQLFLFPVAEIDLVFWLAAGLVSAATHQLHSSDRSDPTDAGDTAHEGAGGLPAAISAGLMVGLAAVVGLAGALDAVANVELRSVLDRPAAADAAEAMGAVRSRRPDSIRYLFITSRLESQAGSLDRALDAVERGLEVSPEDPALRAERTGLLLERARVAPESQDRDEALAVAVTALEDLVVDDPRHPLHLARLGIARALAGDYDGALDALDAAIVLAPDQPELQLDRDEVVRLQSEAALSSAPDR